jgi:tetratricopeptide (TPR) repeat protein
MGHKYVLLARVESPTGTAIVTTEAAAESADEIPAKVDEIADTMRRKLGESLQLVKDNSLPLAKVSSSSLDALRYFTLGKEALYNGDPPQAALMFSKAVEVDPNFAMAHEYLGATYQHLNQYANGSEQIAEAARLADRVSEPERLRILAAYYGTRLDFQKECQNYELLAELLPLDPSPFVNLGVCHNSLFDYDAAVSFTEKALKFVPQSGVRINLASQLASKGDTERALQVALPFSREFPTDSYAQTVLGRIYLALGRSDDARQTFTALTRAGGDAEVSGRLFLADMALSQGKYVEAQKELNASITGADRNHNRVAAVKARIALAETMLQSNPNSPQSQRLLAHIDLPSDSPGLDLLLGRTCAWAGDLDAARKHLHALDAQINQSDVPAVEALRHLLSAEIALAQRNYAEAVEMAQKAVTYQNSVFALETLARSYAAAGMNEQAAQQYELLIARAPELLDDTHVETFDEPAYRRAVESHFRLGALYQKLGRPNDARLHLQKFLAYWSQADPKSEIYQQAQGLLREVSLGSVPTPAM